MSRVRDLIRGVLLGASIHINRLRYWYLAAVVVLSFLVGAIHFFLFLPAPGFTPRTIITVESGTSVRHEAALLREAGLIHSTFLFRVIYRFLPNAHGVQAGVYEYDTPVGELELALDLASGNRTPHVTVTFPEGTTVRQMGKMLGATVLGFDEQKFDSLALPDEGYLFPDTYFLRPDVTEEEAIQIFQKNYLDHFEKHQAEFIAFGKSEHDVITMASLIEGEGKTLEDKRIIAGILWKRIDIGMRLQVDAPFGYIYGLTGYTPTAKDLQSNSGYNTYRYKGLPQGPINNPGDESILATLTPKKTDYLYYLTGTDGTMHYAKTFAEHVANKNKYLK